MIKTQINGRISVKLEKQTEEQNKQTTTTNKQTQNKTTTTTKQQTKYNQQTNNNKQSKRNQDLENSVGLPTNSTQAWRLGHNKRTCMHAYSTAGAEGDTWPVRRWLYWITQNPKRQRPHMYVWFTAHLTARYKFPHPNRRVNISWPWLGPYIIFLD